MTKPMTVTMVALGLGYWAWAGLFACGEPAAEPAIAPIPSEPAALHAPVSELCSGRSGWKRRVYVNVTYESAEPSYAVAIAQRELMHREGEATYVNAGTDQQSSSLTGKLPVGQDLSWLSQLDVGRVTNISNQDSPVQPELDQLCDRLGAVERGEERLLEALAGSGDREAAAVMLELARNEITNLRHRIRSLNQESQDAQINLSFNPVQAR